MSEKINPFDLLIKDHRKVKGLFEEMEKIEEGDSEKCEKLFGEVKKELETHTQIEEDNFYPATKAKEETNDLTLEAFQEHKQVKELLKELTDMTTKGTAVWMAKFKVMSEDVEHHVKEEEEELFPKTKKLFSEEELDELGQKMFEEKQKLLKA